MITVNNVKSIIFEDGYDKMSIDIGNRNTVTYNSTTITITNDELFNYLFLLFKIIEDWQTEYIDLTVIDGGIWKLSIDYLDGTKKKYLGRSKYPSNFHALENLNKKLIGDKYYESI